MLSDPEAAGGGLAHSAARPPCAKILTVVLVEGLDDALHQLSRGTVVGVLGDGDHTETPLRLSMD